MLYLFDLDGTLITSYMDNPDKDYHTWEPLPRRAWVLGNLRDAGHLVAVVTNQAGVAFHHITKQDWRRKWAGVTGALLLPANTPCAVCFAHPKSLRATMNTPEACARRKPSGAMIRELMQAHPDAAATGVLYVGDREEDELAAKDAGVSFEWAWEFFGDPPPTQEDGQGPVEATP